MRFLKKDPKYLFDAINQNPGNALLHQRLAAHFFSPCFRGNVINFYRIAIKKNPNCILNKVYLAKAFYFSCRFREMDVLLDYIFDQKSFPPLTYILKAHLQCVYEEFEQAEESYLMAVKLNRLIQDKWLENRLWGLKYDRLQMAI